MFSEFNLLHQSSDDVPVSGNDIEDDDELVGGEGNLYDESEEDEILGSSAQNNSQDQKVTTDDGWTLLEDEGEEDEGNDIPEAVIRQLCSRIITEKAKQRNKILSQQLVDSFCDRIISILKGGSF